MVFPKTKIVCTIGPACNTLEQVCRLIENGMSVARLNFSHGSHDSHAAMIDIIRCGGYIGQESGCKSHHRHDAVWSHGSPYRTVSSETAYCRLVPGPKCCSQNGFALGRDAVFPSSN